MSDGLARRTGFSSRALASLALFCAGVWLVPSGIALHFASHDGDGLWSHLFMSMHNASAVLFLAAAIVHVILNWKTLTHYVNARVGEYAKFKRELLMAALGVSGFVLFAASHALIIP
jgi:hypothetical protein